MSWREHPPTVGEGKNRQVVPFENWWAQLTGEDAEEVPCEIPEISDEEIERAMKMGRMGLIPPGMKLEET